MFAIVVDEKGFKVEFVILDSDKKTQSYELKDGEKIIEEGWDIANAMLKPKWDGEKWVETGTPEPIPEPQPTEIEVLKKEKEALAKSVYDLTEIVELIITGGVNQ